MDFLNDTDLNYEKCGEIITAIYVNKRVFALKCYFCAKSCENLEDFIDHIEKHTNELTNDSSIKKEIAEETPQTFLTSSQNFFDTESVYDKIVDPIEIKPEVELITDCEENLQNEDDPLNNVSTSSDECSDEKEAEALQPKKTRPRKKTKEKNDEESSSTKKKRVLPPIQLDKQQLEIIEIYKSFPTLWDIENMDFQFKTKRKKALEEMLATVEEKLQLKISVGELQKKLSRIRAACTQEKYLQQQCERLGTPYQPTCKFYLEISFLLDHVTPFKCPHCTECFKGASQYKMHKSKHSGKMPFICPICKRGFSSIGNCAIHLRRHTNDRPFKCNMCEKAFASSDSLIIHKRYHTDEKPYFCEICGKTFRTGSFFSRHKRRHDKRPLHFCTLCNKGFYEKNKLNEHMKGHLNVRDKVCSVCGKTFFSVKHLWQHKKIHDEKKQYVCKICGKEFAQSAGLSCHMKSHGTTAAEIRAAEDKNKIKNKLN